MDPVDLLVFGPHPDDIEIGLAGTIAKHAALGHAVGLCDLTAGEVGSNGTVEERLAEAEAARAVLGAKWRINLRWPDREIDRDAGHSRAAAIVIRTARPRAIAIPYGEDRHPDQPWKADWVCYYFINDATVPSFVVDVTEHYERKRAALACHRTQFAPQTQGAVTTRLTSPLFLQLVESRDAQFGAQAGVQFAEGVIVREPIVRRTLFKEPA
jgi:LmbE family N-acetylglucosaminyl deacetylase